MFCPSRLFCSGVQRPIELPHVETFPGAACCKPTELQYYKAAPLQAVGIRKLVRHSQIFEDENEAAGGVTVNVHVKSIPIPNKILIFPAKGGIPSTVNLLQALSTDLFEKA